MAQSKHTKKALLVSGLSLLTCVALLIGSTFAWFTDSSTSGRNTITAGNLDVELYQVVNGGETPVTQDTNLFDDTALWEPGHVETVVLKVANEGTLALEYSLDVMANSETPGTNVQGDSFRLSDYIRLAAVDGNNTYANRDTAIAAAEGAGAAPISEMAAAKNGVLSPQNSSDDSSEAYVTLILYMPTTVGNEVNYRGSIVPSITLGVSLTATQTPYEEDSFGDDYDDKAGVLQFTQAGEYTVDLDEAPAYGNGDWGVVQAQGDDVTVNITGDGVVKAQESEDRYAMAVYAGGGGTVNIYGGYYSQEITGPDNQYDMIYADNGGYINIYGGTFKSETPKWTLNVLDSAYTNGTARITVYGGTFYKYNPAASQTEPGNGEPVSFVADGYTVVQDGDWYTVVKKVTGTDSLAEAVESAAAGTTLLLTQDMPLVNALNIDKSITIQGDGNALSAAGADRVLNITGTTEPLTLTLKDVDLQGPTSGNYTRGISFYDTKNVTLIMDGCSVSANYYALNAANANENLKLVIRNSTITGWCAFQTHSPGVDVTIENCTLVGLNDKDYNADGWNDFSTVVVNAYSDGNPDPNGAHDCTLTFKNCRIEANQTTGNRQDLLSVRAENTTVVAENCTFYVDGKEISTDQLANYVHVYPEVLDTFTFTVR